jgi:hypothetical protein
MFLRGMPHLCDKMRRLTTKDIAGKRKNKSEEEHPTPDFYTLARDNPLPEITSLHHIQMAALMAGNNINHNNNHLLSTHLTAAGATGGIAAAAPPPPMHSAPGAPQGTQQGGGFSGVELALLERRRADIFDRMNSLNANALNMNNMGGGGMNMGMNSSSLLQPTSNPGAHHPQGVGGAGLLGNMNHMGNSHTINHNQHMNSLSNMNNFAPGAGNMGMNMNMNNYGALGTAGDPAVQRQMLNKLLGLTNSQSFQMTQGMAPNNHNLFGM